MTIAELKEFINRLPDTMGNYTVENAEYTGSNGDDVMYRLDKPVVAIYVREDTGRIIVDECAYGAVRGGVMAVFL